MQRKRVAKRSKKAKDAIASESVASDIAALHVENKSGLAQYGRSLAVEDSSDESDVDGDLGEEGALVFQGLAGRAPTASARESMWFSNPIFDGVESLVAAQASKKRQRAAAGGDGGDSSDEEKVTMPTADEVMAAMPLTDKEKRKVKRKKIRERNEYRKDKRKRQDDLDEDAVANSGLVAGGIQLVQPGGQGGADDEVGDEELTPAQREARRKKRNLIKAGMGAALEPAEGEKVGMGAKIEMVPEIASGVGDDREYDSGHEDYDDDEQAQTLALGTMMLRRSRAKEIVDASYNRYAWNDAADLPSWFVDEEKKHNRPQLPIPKSLELEMRKRFEALTNKPINKVAEARARKRMRAARKLKSAKSQSQAIAANPDMNGFQKTRMIERAMARGQKIEKTGKVYVATRRQSKGGAVKTDAKGKGKVKLVDQRMKADSRGEKAAEKRKKKGSRGRRAK